MRTENISLWILCLLIPVAMATYIFGADDKREESSTVVQALVKQVQQLQLVVASQGERIEALEERLKAVEADEKSVKQTDNSIVNETPADSDTDQNNGERLTKITGDVPIQAISKENGMLRRGIRTAEGVAFSVYLDHRLDKLAKDSTIRFNQALFNDGNHYNTHSGVFTAPISGVYFFTYSIMDWQTGYEGSARLVVDDVHVVSASVLSDGHTKEMGGNSAIVRVQAGQVVWVQTFMHDNTHLFSTSGERYVTFSGFLLY